jgi:hypothetical protein
MDWIDDNIAVGNWLDAHCVRNLRREKVDLIIDSRTLFSRPDGFRSMPEIDLVTKAARHMVELSHLELRVLVFCNHGKDRSPFLTMVYLTMRHGMSCDQAYQLIKSKRPRTVYHPDWVEKLNAPNPQGA